MKTTALFANLTVQLLTAVLFCLAPRATAQDIDVQLLDVPDYDWYAGCFGTACGNLMGYWDRNGFPDFYTGPTGGGLAPLDSYGTNVGIRSMWASRAGFDGRPSNKPGHIDDYWLWYRSDGDFSYENTSSDPYVTAGRPEHSPDCVGDFIGLSQKKWTNLGGECDGNIDAFSFVFWDTNGNRRANYYQTNGTAYVPDIQSGLREWTKYRAYDADVFTQLANVNPHVPAGHGFTFADLKAEIDAGYPVLIFLQDYEHYSRSLPNMPRANPEIHGMLAYGYAVTLTYNYVHTRNSWGGFGGVTFNAWAPDPWFYQYPDNFQIRGAIAYHPKPRIRSMTRSTGNITFTWDGPSSHVLDNQSGTVTAAHRYKLYRSATLNPAIWKPVGAETTNRTMVVSDSGPAFYKIGLGRPGEVLP